jgi:peptide/nickel transport system substrate-binding protein
MIVSRRVLLAGAAGLSAAACAKTSKSPAGKILIVGLDPEPLSLTSAASIDPGTLAVSGKIFDRLFVNDADGKVRPQLAESLSVSPDGLAITINLRKGVRWHDGKPFTSADVAYSLLKVWRVTHARGYLSYANVTTVETPSPEVAVIRLTKPAPYIYSSLADGESQVVPKHLYDGIDVLANPANVKPVGTGPFRFVSWERGSHIVLQRNPDYWDKGKPHLDQIYFRFLKDPSANVAALETGAIQLIAGGNVPISDLARLKTDPAVQVKAYGPAYTPTLVGIGFNLDRPLFQDVRVRRAIAHATDRQFILKEVYQGYGTTSDSPIPPQFTEFYNGDVPKYPFDLAKAEALLDEAGHKRGPDGIRFSFVLDPKLPSPQIARAAQFVRTTLAKIGVKVEIRSQALGEYLNRVFTRRDFDVILYNSGFDIDPVMGIQRFYWSKTFQPGVPFSNATHYGTPEVDSLLERGQVELDPVKRKAIYDEVQRVVQRDLPIIPILFPSTVTVSSPKLRDADLTRQDNFANAVLDT